MAGLVGVRRSVGWWPFDETSGSVARDASGQGNDGTILGTPGPVPGKIGGALQFNGSTYVNCGNKQVFNITDAVTLAAWVQADPDFAYPDWSGIIMRGGPNIDTFALYYNRSSQQLGFKTTGTNAELVRQWRQFGDRPCSTENGTTSRQPTTARRR